MALTTLRSLLRPEQIRALMGRINPARVAERRVDGRNLSYVEVWDIKAALIRMFGFGGFSAEVIDSKIVQIREVETFPQHVKADGKPKTPEVTAQSTVRLTIFGIGPRGEDAVYTETAIGSNSGWTIGDTADNAIKSASSDALKRCAIYLGTQFGLSLYAKTHADVVGVLLPQWQADALVEEPHPETQTALDRATTVVADPNVAPSEDTVALPGDDPAEEMQSHGVGSPA
jgi:recombination DNA repair RAD52 pathway protein